MAVIGLMTDPGLPERLTRGIGGPLQDELSRWAGFTRSWRVDVSKQALALDEDGTVPLMDRAEELKNTHEWDLVVYVIDLPRTHDHQNLVTELSACSGAALISLPALGGIRVRRALLEELIWVVKCLILRTRNPKESTDTQTPAAQDARDTCTGADQGTSMNPNYRTVRGKRGDALLLAGMVRSNRPGRLVGSLSSAAAAAMATGAFGIFYASIWNMADSSSTLRLSMISVLAITVLTIWLIGHNGMWSRSRTSPDGTSARLDNAATVITVLLSVTVMYAGLYAAVFIGSVAIIPGHYMQAQLGHPVSIVEYANLSWLSASLGTLAGALGSNFDGDTAVRRATYSGREHQRRQLEHKEPAASDSG